MCSTSFTDAPVSTTLQDELAKEVTDLRDQLAGAQASAMDRMQQLNRVRENLQQALLEIDDPDRREITKDFLEEATGWEFKLTRRFRARITVEVTFEAESEDAAENVEIDVQLATYCDLEDFEVEDVTVDRVSED